MQTRILCLLSVAVGQVYASHRFAIRNTTTTCRASLGSDSWPSDGTWDKLNETTGGRLLKPAPPGAVCFQSHASYSASKCSELQARWGDEFFHSEDPVSVEWNNWTNDTCVPFPTWNLTCSTATSGYPVYVINATTPQHIKAGIEFAKAHNIRLIIKNSGHDYIGRSTAPNSLSIWVHHMRGITLHEKSFSPKNCSVTIDGPAVTTLAGTQMLEAYEETAKHNYTVIGGNGRTVAMGGFITGGGHSILAPTYGLAVDQVLEMEMVSPSGELLTLNECQNTDLFWAMRGGGGGTFGVLTSVTSKIIPSPSVLSMEFYISTPYSNPEAFDMLQYVVSKFPRMADSGVSGYPIIINTVPYILNGTIGIAKGITGKFIMLNTNKPSDMMNIWQPILNHVNTTWPNTYADSNVTWYPSYNAWYREHHDPSPAGQETVVGSRLLDEEALTANPSLTKLTLGKISSAGSATVFLVSGKGVHNAKPRGGSTSVLPAWRRTYVHTTTSLTFLPQAEQSRQGALRATEFVVNALKELAPNTGAYMNEASKYETDYQKTFWGDNYPRLLQIKRKVDPEDIFWCAPCVGNERWQEVDNRLCRI